MNRIATITAAACLFASAQSFALVDKKTEFIQVNTNASYLLGGAKPATYIDLTAYKIVAGDKIELQGKGAYLWSGNPADFGKTSQSMLGVFVNAQGQYLYPGAGTTAPSIVSLPRYTDNAKTDIPQDFDISFGTKVIAVVPAGATKLLFSVNDALFDDNTSNAGFGVNATLRLARLPLVNTDNSPLVCAHSYVSPDTLALYENIPLIGVPFSLHYSTERFYLDHFFKPKTLGLGGWTPSLLHLYDNKNKTLYYGTGQTRNLTATTTSTGYTAVDAEGSEFYTFDNAGRLLSTTDTMTGVVKYYLQYDSTGRVSGIVDRFNNKTSFTYASNKVSIVSPYGQTTVLNIDAKGFLSSVVNPKSEAYTLTYDAFGLLLTFQKPGGQKSTVTYDEYGFVTKDQGAGGDYVSFIRQYNANSAKQTVVMSTAMNRKTTYTSTSNKSDSQHSVQSPSGAVTQTTNSAQGANTSIDIYGNSYSATQAADPRFSWSAPYETSSSYTVPNSSIKVTKKITKKVTLGSSKNVLDVSLLQVGTMLQDNSQRLYSTTYDKSQRLITTTSPMKRVTYQLLSPQGLVQQTQVGDIKHVYYSTDARGRITAITQSDRTTSLTYDSAGNLATSTNVLGLKTSYQYDAANRLVRQTLPDGNVIAMTYDANGNRTSITPPGKTAHTFSYNLFELVANYVAPSLGASISGATTYSYNLEQQVTKINRPDGASLTFTYDSAGRLTTTTAPIGNYTKTYSGKTDLVSAITAPGDVQLKYQYLGNLPAAITTSGSITSAVKLSYNADASLNILSVEGRSGSNSIAMAYDLDGLTTKVGSLALTRNNAGAVNASTLGKVIQASTFNPYGELKNDKYTVDGKSIFNQSYRQDNAGRINEIDDYKVDATKLYTYDSQSRLTQVNINGTVVRSYKYDSNGNRIQMTAGSTTTTAKYDAQDRMTQYGVNQYSYNNNGDLTTKLNTSTKKSTAYAYDVFGNLRTVTLPDGRKIEYLIDGQNRRVGKKINGVLVQAFVYQSQTQIAAELDGTGILVKRFVYAEKSNVPDYMVYKGKEYRIISDQVGTPRLLVDASAGTITETLDWDEFGNPAKAATSLLPFGFAGGIYDRDTGLVRFGARDYDPETGRWTMKDPIGFEGGLSNLYGYVANSPLNNLDPNGLKATLYNFGNGLGVHFVLRVDDPSSPSGMQYIDFAPSSSNDASITNTTLGSVEVSPNYMTGLKELTQFNTSTMQDAELIKLALVYQVLGQTADYKYQFLSSTSKSHGNCGSFIYDLLKTVGAL